MQQTSPTIGFISLGCPKALVDSERILTQLRAEGYQLSNTYQNADLVVINTCGFIEDAVQESLDTIGEALFENGKVIVTGSLGGREDGAMVLDAYPEVLAVSGAHAYEQVMEHIHQHLPPQHEPFLDLIPPQGVKLTPKHYAYLKISEGCHHKCSFCIIPQLRGTLNSRPIGQVLDEAQRLVDNGVRELLIVSQDTSAYGLDTKYKLDMWGGRPMKTRFYDLVKGLSEMDVWTRLHYVYPYPHVDEVIELMNHNQVLPYLDIPFQHADPTVLKNMRRPAAAEKNLERIEKWRAINPDIAIRSTFIVGFPGETDAQFESLLEFIEAARLDRVGCFKYSPVDGAPAHQKFPEVPEDIQEDRFERFMALQAKISADKLKQKIDKQMKVLVDEMGDERIVARSYADAPEIDGVVYLPLEAKSWVKEGEFVQVKVTEVDEYDLYADPIGA